MQNRHTVCPQPVNTQTSYISWNDADYAASIGAPHVSPFKAGSPADHEWLRMYGKAKTAAAISGVTPMGRRTCLSGE